MYKYCHDMYSGDPNHPDYDAVQRRSASKGGDSIGTGSSSHKSITKKSYCNPSPSSSWKRKY